MPEEEHTFTTVDQFAFPAAEERERLATLAVEDRELLDAMEHVAKEWLQM